MSVSPWLVLLAFLVYGAAHSVLASARVKAGVQRRLGGWGARGYRLAYNLFAVLSFLPVLALPIWLPDQEIYAIPSPWVYFTLLGQGLAVVALAVGLIQTGLWDFLGLQQIVKPPVYGPGDLVVRGLYRGVRHPMYTAGLVFIWLTPVMTLNLLALSVGLSLYIIVGAKFEERRMVHQFGETYKRYQERTPMLIPNLRLYQTKPDRDHTTR